MHLSVRLPDTGCGATPENLARVAVAAEHLGFAGVSVQDHYFVESRGACPDGQDSRTIFDALQALTYVAALTQRVRLLTAVLVAPLYHPARLAKQAASLDTLSGGRLTLGIGVGAQPVASLDGGVGQHLGHFARVAEREYALFGVRGNRGRATDELLRVMRAIWADETVSAGGGGLPAEPADVFPKPIQRPGPPVWMGGRSAMAQERAVRLGDGWMPSQCSVPVLRAGAEHIEELCARRGRPMLRSLGPNIFVVIARTDAEAEAGAARELGERFDSREALLAATLVGSPPTVARRIGEYQAAGATVLDLKFLPWDVEETLRSMELFAEHVMPALASA